MLKSSLCGYSDVYILVKGTITVKNTAAADADGNDNNKKVIFKNCFPFPNCISEINNSKTSGSLWKYCKDISAVDDNNAIINFAENNLTDSLNFKVKMTGKTGYDGTKNLEIMVPLKYLSNFWRTLEMPLINCEINLILA